MNSSPIVHIIDDDPTIRETLRLLLSMEGFEAKCYSSALEFLAAMSPGDPGCVVTDVRMPGMTGVELLNEVHARGVNVPFIMISGHADVPLAVHAMKLGAADLLEKPFAPEALIDAIRNALKLSQDQQASQLEAQDIVARFSTLSAREREVLAKLVEGQPNKVIAYELGISHRTVEVHRANVMRKTQAGSLSELVRMSLTAARA
jgi:two-component system response regulator FixJ